MSSKQSNASASKKIRMTMACERCRSKKVKCDFAHPQCGRCQQAKVDCSYDGSATQIDLFNLVKLNETVDLLQKRVQSIESDIKDVCSNTQYVANEIRVNRESSSEKNKEKATVEETQSDSIPPIIQRNTNGINRLMAATANQWSLSLTPKGLRIDTNIASLHDLYDILLSGISQFEFPNNVNDPTHLDTSSQSSSSTSGADSPNMETVTLKKRKPLWKTRIKAFPLYSSWEPDEHRHDTNCKRNDTQQDDDIKTIEKMPFEVLKCMIDIYDQCFLCFPCYDPNNSVAVRFKNGTLDLLLANSIFAWTARHAAIYHNLFPGKDPNQVGHSFFLKAKSLVKERFMKTSVDTMHSLLIMYIYAIGIPSKQKVEVESEAYIYLGLAIRMCLDLKMNVESKSNDVYERESHRRFFWSLHFLETLGSIHSDRPFALPPDNTITTGFPTVMKHEEEGEKRYQVEFMIQRYKITRIYRDIIWKTTEEKPLFSQISALDKQLQNWHHALPSYFKFKAGDIHKRNWSSTSFKEQACIKLNFEYNFQLCQLYSLFLSRPDEYVKEENSTIEVLSRDICIKAANNTVELLECWTHLKQLWCHFSLENLMMTTYIYGCILSQPENNNHQQIETIKLNLKKIANILISSPVRHHHYVITLINRIKSIFKDTLNMDLQLEDVCPTGSQHQVDSTNAGSTVHLNPPTHTSSCSSHPVVHLYAQSDISATSSVNTSLSLGSDQFSPRVINFFDTNTPASHFDMHFSDFVYTPTVLDYAGPIDQANLMTTREYTEDANKAFNPYASQGHHHFEQTNHIYQPNTSSPQSNTNLPFNNQHHHTLHHPSDHQRPQQHSNQKQSRSSPLASSSWVPLHPPNVPPPQPILVNRSHENYYPPPPPPPPSHLSQPQAPPSQSPSQQAALSNRTKDFYQNYDSTYYQ